MLSAIAVSALFLVSYLTRSALAGTHHFQGVAWLRGIYLAILFTHMILAAAIVPLVLRMLWLVRTSHITRHRRLGRIVMPIWIYVSFTGVAAADEMEQSLESR